jgi:integrase
VPWLCAYTGARVGEFSQLRGEDVQKIDGIWAARLTPDAGTVKTKEARTVPLHEHLIAQGFLDFVAAHGPGPLFYDPGRRKVQSDSNRHIKKVGEHLGKWVRAVVGVNDPALQPNHAWRNTFKTAAYAAGIQEAISDAIQGHSARTTGRGYNATSLATMAGAIQVIPRYEL